MSQEQAKREKPEWWNYVKKIMRQYPQLKQKIETPLPPKMGGSSGGGEGKPSGGVSSPVERCVIHDLPPKEQRRFDAVDNAIQRTKKIYPHDYKPRMMIIDLVYFSGTHTLAGAALKVGCHENTAGKYSADFIRLVAEELDLP